MKDEIFNYSVHYQQNAKCVEIINRAWGERVAWLEDQLTPGGRTVPVIRSILVRGALPGRPTFPPFQSMGPPESRRPRRKPAPRQVAMLAELEAPDPAPPEPAAPPAPA